MEFERRGSSGVAKGGLTTGIIGTSLGALALLGTGANGIGSLLGGGLGRNVGSGQAYFDGLVAAALMNGGNCGSHSCGCCESDHFVTRYDAEKDARIAELESANALRDANTYSDQKMLEMYKYLDGRMRGIEAQIGQQAVINESIAGQMKANKAEQECCCQSLRTAIEHEAQERCCADTNIVNYTNATFYPQMISDLTIGTTATKQQIWNPLPKCGSNCGK